MMGLPYTPRNGRLILWCPDCNAPDGTWFYVRDADKGACPACHKVPSILKCCRCGHVWIPRKKSNHLPAVCPSCSSPYWNRERMTTKGTINRGDDRL